MVVIEDEIVITRETIRETHDAEHLEKVIEEKMHESLCVKMKTNLQEMALLDIEPRDSGDFEVKASVVLVTTQDMLTALQRLATHLRELELDEDEIETALAVFESTKGF